MCREKFPGNFGQYSSHFGSAQEGCTAGKWDFRAGVCGSKGTALMVGRFTQHHPSLRFRYLVNSVCKSSQFITRSACGAENARPLDRGNGCVRAPVFCPVHEKNTLFEVEDVAVWHPYML